MESTEQRTEPDPPVDRLRTAVLIPCYNEEHSIVDVVAAFRKALPGATIFVYDNNSQDRTAELAREARAIVRMETRQGKGNVVRRMFADTEADVYTLVEGDGTYDAASAPSLISLLLEDGLDMVNAARDEQSDAAYRPGHRFGNVGALSASEQPLYLLLNLLLLLQ